MIKSAAAAGCIDERAVMCETAVAAYRAGTDIYLTYFAKELAQCMAQGMIG
jgi:porphobilinogen synthase